MRDPVVRATSVTKAFSRGWWPRRREIPVLRGADLELRRGEIGYRPQDPVLYDRLTCDEHFELFGRAYASWSS